MANKKPPVEANRPETYLNASERANVQRLLSFPEEFPQKFLAWLQDYLRVNIPQFPLTQVHGFQSFNDSIQQFMLGQGANWTFINAKGDLIVGYDDNRITVLPVGSDGTFLIADSTAPSGLRWGQVGKFEVGIDDDATVAVTGSPRRILTIPSDLNGAVLTHAHAFVTTASTSGALTIQFNLNNANNMLSTAITIDEGELSSYTAATPPVINTAHDDVATGDQVLFNVSAAGAGAKGLGVIAHFTL